jgi:hypothetical protein
MQELLNNHLKNCVLGACKKKLIYYFKNTIDYKNSQKIIYIYIYNCKIYLYQLVVASKLLFKKSFFIYNYNLCNKSSRTNGTKDRYYKTKVKELKIVCFIFDL